ncbi:rhamnogalacturonan acetylesterase [Anatilimnocola floriformis]|uniref:rhamnogalacturonan acetylesterase n=1 Tax=Anatilimnocola floriformis TaxID=2948575 RepID=UPI0020C210DB|nr:rhamnogalacturonan acetylesterase [Anatilimnocola floriformis]
MSTLLRFVFCVALVCCSTITSIAEEPKPATVKITLVGDSTVTDKAGWGAAFIKLVGPNAECVNHAKGGASSKSYYDSGLWKRALAAKPTYVLIQFGHNDQPGKGPERETDPANTYRDQLKKYISEARAAGAKPILVTSLVRRIFTADGKINSSLTPYAEAVKAVAAETKTPVIDLHERSKELAEKLGVEKSQRFGPPHPTQAGKFDGTHLNDEGAAAIAPLVVAELLKAEPELQPYFPTKP